MNEPLTETFTRKEIQDRFRKTFGREMTAIERRAFFLPPETVDDLLEAKHDRIHPERTPKSI